MKTKVRLFLMGLLCWCASGSGLRADVLEMQNGDRYSGKVLAVSADTILLNSEILGKVRIPRNKVATLTISENGSPPRPAATPPNMAVTNAPAPAAAVSADTNQDLSAMLRELGGATNFIAGIRQQMFAGNPQGAAKFDDMVNQLLSGQMNLADLRRQAAASAQQLRDLKKELGPETDDALDGYLQILEAFVNESPSAPGAPPQK